MQEYDETFFRAKANKRAGLTWLTLMIIASVYYGIRVASGKLDVGFFTMFSVVGWADYIASKILLKVKGEANERYKWMLGIGYMMFYHCMDFHGRDVLCIYFTNCIHSDSL